MSKAIAGAAMIAADVAIGAALFLDPMLVVGLGVLGTTILNGVIMSLFAGGVSMEAGALAEALSSNRAENITVRLAAGLRQIIYGMQRVGGNIIYQSTTGAGGASGNYVYNYVITVATHEIDAFINLYLDGRQVFFRQDGNAANIGCGAVAQPFTATASIAGGAVTGIAVSGSGSGYSNVKAARYRVRIWGGGGSGAAAYATNSGTSGVGSTPVFTVVVTAGGSGYTVPPFVEIQGAYVFGGVGAADEQDPAQPGYGIGYGIGPSGEHYNFSGKVFCEARYGDQLPGDSMTTLTANDSVWPTTANVGGCAYLYVNIGYDTQLFQNPPEIRITVKGKNSIYDPRSGRTGYSANWALQVADVITDPLWGLGDGPGNANVLINGDFSLGTAGWTFESGWAISLGTGTPAGTGNVAVFTGPGTAAVVNNTRIVCFPGDIVTAACYGLGENGAIGTAELRLTFYDQTGAQLGVPSNSSATTPNTYVWTLLTLQIAAPASAAYAIADFAVIGGGAGPRWAVWNMAATVPNTGAVNRAQLIAAANVCDELVATSQGSEARYTQHMHFDTSMGPGDVLQMMMPTAAGRLGRIGGEWWIWPAYWQGSSFAFDSSALIDAPSWTPYRSYKDLFNRVNGTYIAPNFPYSVAGNLYDKNGWYYGVKDNVWPFAFQSTNFPQYAADQLHGYAADEYLEQDGGVQLPRELTLRGVISITQAQRVAKIALMRNRFQGTGSFAMGLEAWQVQPVDVVEFTWNIFGWSQKLLEVTEVHFICEPVKREGVEDDQTLALSVQVSLEETDPTIYQWSTTEELTPYDVPANPNQIPTVPAAPTEFTVTSSAGTAIVGADGIVIPRARLEWNAPLDISVTMIQMQYQAAGASAWIEAGAVDVGLFVAFVEGVVAGQTYNFRIRSIRRAGVWSAWVEVDGEVISITLTNTVGIGYAVAPSGTLSAQAFADGTAQIIVSDFTAVFGSLTAACHPSPNTLPGLAQSQLYYVYYQDPNFAGGTITPVATQNTPDFVNKIGYFLIGSIVTPSYTPYYAPTAYHDIGASSSVTPSAAYDRNVTTNAIIQAYLSATGSWIWSNSTGDCLFSGFPSLVTAAAMTLTVNCSLVVYSGITGSGQVIAHIGATNTTVATLTGNTAQADHTLAIPSGTDLSTFSVEAIASITAPPNGTSGTQGYAHLNIYEISIQ